jgi:predicted DNA-binding transcriptional regulator AlpA
MLPLPIDLDHLPGLLRCTDIVRDTQKGYPGILPMSRAAFLSAVARGMIAEPVQIGRKAVAWRKADILAVLEHGIGGKRRRGSSYRDIPAAAPPG